MGGAHGVAAALRVLGGRLLVLLAALLPAPLAFAQIPVLRLTVELDPTNGRLQVDAGLRTPNADFHVVLHESLQPAAASADGKALAVRAAGGRGAMKRWRVDAPAGAELRLRYGGRLPALELARDHREVLQAMPPMASAEGSFLAAGSGWYPRPAALFAYTVDVVVKGGQPALVAGRLEHEQGPAAVGTDYRARFVFDGLADGIDLMAGPWVVRERLATQADARPLRLRTYFPAALDAEPGLADAYLDDSRRYIERYAAQIGAYPFTEFSVVASPLPTGFGMPTLTYIGEQVLRLPFIRATSLGHEVLHNWWGNGVLVDYERGNWSEGLTTFMADYAFKAAESAAAAREMRLGWLRDFAALPAGSHAPLAAFRARTHGAAAAVGYGKAAMVFVMLQDEIGEDAFARGIRLFWAQQRFRSAGWDDLRAAFEEAAGRPLEGFFRQWLELPGGPAPRIERARVVEQAGKGARLRVSLAQPAPVHALRVPLRLVAGEQVETQVVEFSAARAELELTAGFVPEGVLLDPDLRLWRLPEAVQLPLILRQWIVAAAPRLVIADTLAEGGGVAVGAVGTSAALGGARPGADSTLAEAAQALAARLFERAPMVAGFTALSAAGGPVLLVGSEAAVAALLVRAGLPAQPEGLPADGTARVWTVQRDRGPALAVIAAADAAALRALQRPLPHYGSQSWLVFDGPRARARGVWEAPGRVVAVER
jgi:aminopeptidase N